MQSRYSQKVRHKSHISSDSMEEVSATPAIPKKPSILGPSTSRLESSNPCSVPPTNTQQVVMYQSVPWHANHQIPSMVSINALLTQQVFHVLF